MWFQRSIDTYFSSPFFFLFLPSFAFVLAHVVLSIVVLRDQVYHNGDGEEEEERAEEVQEEEDDEEGGDYEYVLTDEWMEFFAKSEARRQESKYCFFSQI